MKKVIGMLAILFIATEVFGQKFLTKYSFIERSKTQNTIEDWIITGNNNGNFDWIRFVHFIKDDKLYLISYEPLPPSPTCYPYPDNTVRGVYLYSKSLDNLNSPWEKASDVLANGIWMGVHGFIDFDFYRAEKSSGSVGNVVVNGDYVTIIIDYYGIIDGSLSFDEPMTLTLKFDGKFYNKVDNGERNSIQ